jgi:hypothetical protein
MRADVGWLFATAIHDWPGFSKINFSSIKYKDPAFPADRRIKVTAAAC